MYEEKQNMSTTKSIANKKKRYTYEQVKAMTKIQVQLAKENISLATASREILKIADNFPVHMLPQSKKRMQNRFNGISQYGFAHPANWAKALLEETHNDTMIIKALRVQQRLYLEKDGKNNQKLENLLNSLDISN